MSEHPLQLPDFSETAPTTPRVEESTQELAKWTRLAAQACQVPNEPYLETEAGENGCFYVAFSHDGKLLACALSEEYDYPIVVYKVRFRDYL